MNLSKELLEKAKTAKTAEELMKIAKGEGVELGEQEAEKYFARLHKAGELADEELDNVVGGCGGGGDGKPKPRFSAGDYVLWYPEGRYDSFGDLRQDRWSERHVYATVLSVTTPAVVPASIRSPFAYTIECDAAYSCYGTDMGDGSAQIKDVWEQDLTPQ